MDNRDGCSKAWKRAAKKWRVVSNVWCKRAVVLQDAQMVCAAGLLRFCDERDEARYWAGRLLRERDALLKAERDEARAEVNDHVELLDRAIEQHLASLARIAELETELERRCETCRSFHAGTYDCLSECMPLRCVMNNFDGWEAKDELL